MGNISDEKVRELQLKANDVRQSIITSLVEAKSGHTAGSLGMADIFTYLYHHEMKHNPDNPSMTDRDIFILSNGHICPGLYATMAHVGYFPVEELQTLRKFGSRLQGHPHREHLPGIETSSGPLGSGISQAVGMALAMKMDREKDRYVYCCVGDGELNEGQNYEAMLTAAKFKLENLVVIVDRNNIQIDGFTEDVLPLNDLVDKFKSFNFHVQEIDGHNFEMIDDAVGLAKTTHEMPSVIIANTIPGKGVKAFENLPEWHGKAPSEEEGKVALKDLEVIRENI